MDAAGRQGIEETVRRPGPSADRAAASVKEADAHPGLVAERGEGGLRPVQRPLAGEDAAFLVAVAVADHDLLDRGGPGGAHGAQAALRNRVREESAHDGRRAFEVFGSFEERGHGQATNQPLRCALRQARFPREQVHHEQVAELTGHADDERAQPAGAVGVVLVDEQAVAGKHGVGLRSGGRPGVREGARGAQFALDKFQATLLIPFGERFAGVARQRHQLPEAPCRGNGNSGGCRAWPGGSRRRPRHE